MSDIEIKKIELLNTDLPEKIKVILLERIDLLKKNYHKYEKEVDLIKWIIINGQYLYPDLLKGNYKNNEILYWFSKPLSNKNLSKLPKIIYTIWIMHPRHRSIWNVPRPSKSYNFWLIINWFNLKVKVPPYNFIFQDLNFFVNFLIKFVFNEFNHKLKKNLNIQINVIGAIIYHLFILKVFRNKFGFMGLFIEPFGLLFIFLMIRLPFSNSNEIANLDNVLFLSTGILYLTFFRLSSIVPNMSYNSFAPLFNFRQIKPIDVFISTTFFEGAIIIILYLTILLIMFFLRKEIIISDLGTLLNSFFLLSIINFSSSLFFKYCDYVMPFFRNLLPWIARILFFTSGTFFSLSAIPQSIKPFLSWNPILQSVEISRKALDDQYVLDIEYISFKYLLIVTILFSFFMLSIYGITENNLLKR